MLAEQGILYVLLFNALLFIKKINLLTLGIREEHGIPTLMMVGNKETASPIADLFITHSRCNHLPCVSYFFCSLFFFQVI
jgi:hypothetical protein